MTTITPPSSVGTIKATTLGNFIYQIATWGLQQQKDITKNPNQFDYITIAIDPEFEWDAYPAATGGKATIDISFPCVMCSLPFADPEAITVPDYLTSSGFSAGSGGSPTFASSTWTQQLWQAILLMGTLQIDPAKNTSGLTLVTAASATQVISLNSVAANSVNGDLAANIELPLIVTFDATTGNTITSGASPMGALS